MPLADYHEKRRIATMNPGFPNGGPFGGGGYGRYWQPHSDDTAGLKAMYPDSTTGMDVAVSAFKKNDCNGSTNSYSSAITTFYGDPADYPEKKVADPENGTKGTNEVRRGQWVRTEYTFENLGTSKATFNIGYYLSTDSTITTSDRVLSYNYGAWVNAGAWYTHCRDVYLPTDLTVGKQYWLGVIVDNNNAIAEVHEGNNVQQMAGPIKIIP